MLTLKPNVLAVLGHDIIIRVYQELSHCIELRKMAKNILMTEADGDDLSDLVQYLTKTYCQMRGRDYCRQMMVTDFDNLGKCICSKLAVLSNKDNYKKKMETRSAKAPQLQI